MKQNYFKTLLLFTILIGSSLHSQNTVGALLNTANSFNGYSLFTINKETYLINNCGEVINQWTSAFSSGKSVYLLENGNLLRAAQIDNPGNIAIPGVGGRIELFDWAGTLLWSFDFTTPTRIQHHDIFPMPNGNILVLGAALLTDTEAIQMGRNPENLTSTTFYDEHIVELEPTGTNTANVIWEWNFKDHLIQDFDNTKDNFGIVSQNPQKLDINFLGISNGGANWLHVNSLQYNAQLDQIVLSSRHMSEIYIIDHSTTTSEASTSSGGTYGKGGDFLYRWGNPQTYKQGTTGDQKLFGQHYPHWIEPGLNDAGKILLYNNGLNRTPQFSQIDIIDPPATVSGFYDYTTNTAYGPSTTDYTYTATVNTDFFSAILSSAQRLPNGNTLICEGTSGRFFEIDASNNIVWDYVNPVHSSGIMTQGDDPDTFSNNTFRVTSYSPQYAAFSGRTLTPGSPIELNPNLSNCTVLDVGKLTLNEIKIFPNPVSEILSIQSAENITLIEIFNPLGKMVKRIENKKSINISNLSSGFYIVKAYASDKVTTKKVIKI